MKFSNSKDIFIPANNQRLNINLALGPSPEENPEIIVESNVTLPAKVILFNDDWHTFDEVILQLMKAINCDSQQAESIAWSVHNNGKAIVFEGELLECLKVSSILEEIALHTQIEY